MALSDFHSLLVADSDNALGVEVQYGASAHAGKSALDKVL